ncbi:MAG: sigma 54-interacting transcriptional regulator [bacterium]
MSAAASRAERLRALVAEAREAGESGALRAAWRAAMQASKPAEEPGEFPGRFGMIGASPAMEAVYDLLEKAAAAEISVLVHGETGTGKELVARALHSASPRADEAFVAENCAAIPANLLESELFGHVKGAFTGAIMDRKGTFVSADKGTCFLDEIGDMPLEMQAKLLRVLQNGEVRPVGSNKIQTVDVRLVAATNKDLLALCESHEFREDLYYRLSVICIDLPPLRERAGDVALLARFFTSKMRCEFGREFELTPAALALLEAYAWPGNVREFENELRRAAVFSEGKIDADDLSQALGGKG